MALLAGGVPSAVAWITADTLRTVRGEGERERRRRGARRLSAKGEEKETRLGAHPRSSAATRSLPSHVCTSGRSRARTPARRAARPPAVRPDHALAAPHARSHGALTRPHTGLSCCTPARCLAPPSHPPCRAPDARRPQLHTAAAQRAGRLARPPRLLAVHPPRRTSVLLQPALRAAGPPHARAASAVHFACTPHTRHALRSLRAAPAASPHAALTAPATCAPATLLLHACSIARWYHARPVARSAPAAPRAHYASAGWCASGLSCARLSHPECPSRVPRP
jgi:hypothetical protein